MRKIPEFKTKRCFWCGDEYVPTNGFQVYCPECKDEADAMHGLLIRKTQQTLGHAQFPNRKPGKPHKSRICILCGKEFQPDNSTQKYCLECRKKKERQWGTDACFARYGITQKEYDELYQAQNGRCAVCGREHSGAIQSGKRKRMYIDHDHTTGKVRGLLCSNCNIALGFVHDDPELLTKLAEYLRGG
jgi:uncharacterized Zn ribbon protein